MTDPALDEALQRLHRTGPEFDGWLSNHGPMVVEAMARRGHGHAIHPWLDRYLKRLDDAPRGQAPIRGERWRQALGDPRRLGDWLDYFAGTLAERPWPDVLATWWPRLLPGIAASATHGVIRTGHAVHALRARRTPERVAELGHALAYWSARFQPLAAVQPPSGALSPAAALRALVRVPDQRGGIRDRLRQLAELPGWASGVGALRPAADAAQVPGALTELVAAAVEAYLTYERSGNIMLIHAATAPTAVLRTLPALPAHLWQPSLVAAWTTTAAVVSAYASAQVPEPVRVEPAGSAADVFAQAVAHGDEHVVKLADAAVELDSRTGDPVSLAAARYAVATVLP